MKKTLIACCAVLALLASCGENKSTTPKSTPLPKAGSSTTTVEAPKIAYVEVDTLIARLEMCKEAKAALEAKGKSYDQQIAAKQKAFEQAYQSFGQKAQNNGFKSQQEYENAQANLQKLQEDGAKLQQQFAEQLGKEQDAFNTRLHDSLNSYIKDFNADGRYAMILSKSGDNVLYADPSLDLTEEVIKGMNKRYKK